MKFIILFLFFFFCLIWIFIAFYHEHQTKKEKKRIQVKFTNRFPPLLVFLFFFFCFLSPVFAYDASDIPALSTTNGVSTIGEGIYSATTIDDTYMSFKYDYINEITIHLNMPSTSFYGNEYVLWLHGNSWDIRDTWGTSIASGSYSASSNDLFEFYVIGSTYTFKIAGSTISTGSITDRAGGYFGIRNSSGANSLIKDLYFSSGAPATPTPTSNPTPTPTPSVTPTMSYSESIPTPTPFVSNSPDSSKPYLHEVCFDGYNTIQSDQNGSAGYSIPFTNPLYPTDTNHTSEGAYCPYSGSEPASRNCTKTYKLESVNKISYNSLLVGYRFGWYSKGDNYKSDMMLSGFPQSMTFSDDDYVDRNSWYLDDHLVEIEVDNPSQSEVDSINDGLDFYAKIWDNNDPQGFGYFTMPYACLYYYDDNPTFSITDIPTEAGKGVPITGNNPNINNLSDPTPSTCVFNENSILNIPYYFCLLKNWFINVIKWLFVPNSFNSEYWQGMSTSFQTLIKSKAPVAYIYEPFDYIDWETFLKASPIESDLQFDIPIESAKINGSTQEFHVDLNPPDSISSYMSWYMGIMTVVISIPFIYDIFKLVYKTFNITKEVSDEGKKE